MWDGSPKGRGRRLRQGSVYDSPSPKGHAPNARPYELETKNILRDVPMGMKSDDDTVYCDVQMPLAQGKELLHLLSTLRESNTHPTLNRVFEQMQYELSTSIDIVENPPTWGLGRE